MKTRHFRLILCAIWAAGALPMEPNVSGATGGAVVRAVRGRAEYAMRSSNEAGPLKVGKILRPGASIQSDSGTVVDLFLDQNGPVVRMTSETELRIEKLTFEPGAAGPIIETILELRKGCIMAHVKGLGTGSVYEVRTPKAVFRIAGTEFELQADGKVAVLSGIVERMGGSALQIKQGQTFDPATGQLRLLSDAERHDLAKRFGEMKGVAINSP